MQEKLKAKTKNEKIRTRDRHEITTFVTQWIFSVK